MKKLSICLLLLFLISMLSLPVLAAQSAHLSLSASKTALKPGDTFTVTVSTSAVENCTGGSFLFSYDTSIFEYLIGSSSVSGFSSGISNSAGIASGYFNGGSATVQGTLFQVTLQVKDNAPIGSYYISGFPTLTELNEGATENVSCSAGGVTVSIVCDHAWSAWSGTEATCSTAGNLSRTCSKCGYIETDTPAATGMHSYSGWTIIDGTQHERSCTVCSTVEIANHNWEISNVNKQATCLEEGSAAYICSDCGATKTDIIPIADHTYTHGCDNDCNVCGAVRTTSHQYKSTWSSDKNGHWVECAACKARFNQTAHTPGAAATEYTAQTCTICAYIITPAYGHQHNYATEWTTDEGGHWYACSGCNEKGSYLDHDFENDCDPNCSICDYTREITHLSSEDWLFDENYHWHECSVCGQKQDENAHEPDTVCGICGYEISVQEETTAPTTSPDEDTPSVIEQQEIFTFPWWIVPVLTAISAAGIIIVISTRKKQS